MTGYGTCVQDGVRTSSRGAPLTPPCAWGRFTRWRSAQGAAAQPWAEGVHTSGDTPGIALTLFAPQAIACHWGLRRRPYGPVEWLLRAWTNLSLPRWKGSAVR
ncbi:DUF418 domain-containing protein [Nocardiopsis gilva YIM 90087]|uniref:DUF418 domain-containing protein n=1 Tax=Nocardiopsis gilva YIM 90087 TaxID=1235441 RepID=A0A223S9F6_9ACTN|nr:DUF418 domain-containing protein [Nocardiopsis gilva]ASU84741.1 DUF418 domain-containing protein [Nocardiopsis gilva YIM 90087]